MIVSGGAYGSPQLLQLSGLGPGEHLQAIGIEVVRDMPAVGANLHDHFALYMQWRCTRPITFNDFENSWPRKIGAAIRYALTRSGPMAVNGIRAGLARPAPMRAWNGPTCRSTCWNGARWNARGTRVVAHDFPGFTLGPVHLRAGRARHGAAEQARPAGAAGDHLRLPGSDYDMRAMLAGASWRARSCGSRPSRR